MPVISVVSRTVLPIYTSNLFPSLAPRPLLEAALMYIVPTGCPAPDNILCFRFEFREANRAVTADFFTIGRCFGRGRRLGRRGCRSASEYLL